MLYNNRYSELIQNDCNHMKTNKLNADILTYKVPISYSFWAMRIIFFLLFSRSICSMASTTSSLLTITQQQKQQITGHVSDVDGIPIIGANIVEVGTTNGTVTDVEGNFSLNVEENAIIKTT